MKNKKLEDNLYEQCLIDTALRLKNRGFENYQEMATDMCRTRVDSGNFDHRSFALDGSNKKLHVPSH